MEALASLPVLDALTWDEHRAELRTGAPHAVSLGFTSGYTGNPRVYLSTGRERAAFLAASNPSSTERTLNLIGGHHGVVSALDQPDSVISVALLEAAHFEHAARLLERLDEPYRAMPPIEVVAGPLRAVKHLSLFMLRRHENLAGFGVKRLHVFRHMLTPGWAQRLRTWWGAPVVSSYGASELSSCGFLECEDCGHLHPAPSGLVEYLDPDTSQPVAPGARGTLAVTIFHPYVELEPRIRYCPGDLIEVAPAPCPRWGEHGFRPLGRLRHAVRTRDGRWFSAADGLAAIGDLVDVGVCHAVAESEADPRMHEAGAYRFNVEREGHTVVLNVELRYDPLVWPAEAQRVLNQIRRRLGRDDVRVVLHGQHALPGTPCFV